MMLINTSALVLAISGLTFAAPSKSPAIQARDLSDMSQFKQTPNATADALFAAKAVFPGPAANVAVEAVKSKRAITHLYVCQDSNFSGRCQNLASNTGQCYNLYNGFNDVITSLGPDAGTTCRIYDDYGCGGASLGGIVNPGIYNLADYGWNDRFSAYICN